MPTMISRTETWVNPKTGKVISFKVYVDETVSAGGKLITYPSVTQQLEAEGFTCKERDLAVKSDGVDTSITGGGDA